MHMVQAPVERPQEGWQRQVRSQHALEYAAEISEEPAFSAPNLQAELFKDAHFCITFSTQERQGKPPLKRACGKTCTVVPPRRDLRS